MRGFSIIVAISCNDHFRAMNDWFDGLYINSMKIHAPGGNGFEWGFGFGSGFLAPTRLKIKSGDRGDNISREMDHIEVDPQESKAEVYMSLLGTD